jgi:hypothetical protein
MTTTTTTSRITSVLRPNRGAAVPEWTKLADGRLRRLKRGRHFDGSPRVLRHAARDAAQEMGKAVRVVVDRMEPDVYVWVQFADAEIHPDEPCRCGSTALRRVHPNFASCEECGARLIVSRRPLRALKKLRRQEEGEDDGADIGTGRKGWGALARRREKVESKRLDNYSDVHLYPYQRTPERERCYGYGELATGEHVLLLVDFPLVDGERIEDPARPGEHVHQARSWPVGPFSDVVDLTAFPD